MRMYLGSYLPSCRFWLVVWLISFFTFPVFGKESKRRSIDAGAMCAIAVYVGENQIATIGAALLTSLESVSLKFSDAHKKQRGPRLKDLLAVLKLEDYKSITIGGFAKKRVAIAEYTIKKQDINEHVILGFSRRGTVKFISPILSFNDWIVDVNRIDINE